MSDDSNRHRILIVEDESMIAMLLEDALTDLGFSVVGPVARVDHALTLLAATEVDGALLDLNLAGEPSYPVADALAARGCPFVFVTGYGGEGVKAEYRHIPVVQKPFTSERLEHAFASLGLLA